jgi:hypothetical protein
MIEDMSARKLNPHTQKPICPPRIVEAIENGTAPADLTVTSLARALPHGWAEPEQKLGIS